MPSSGEIRLVQDSDRAAEIGRHTHYVGHLPAVTAALTVASNLAFQASILGAAGARLSRVLERVGLGPLAAAPVWHLSAGQKRRLALSRLLIAPRALWLLDEPGESLDAEGESLLAEIGAEHLAAGGLIVLATHVRPPFSVNAELTLLPAGLP